MLRVKAFRLLDVLLKMPSNRKYINDPTRLDSTRCDPVRLSIFQCKINQYYPRQQQRLRRRRRWRKKSIRSICSSFRHKIAFDLKFKPVKRLLDYRIGYVLMFNKSAPFSRALLRISHGIMRRSFQCWFANVPSTSEMLFEFAPWFTNRMSTFARIMIKHVYIKRRHKINALFKHSHHTAAHSYLTKKPVKEKIMKWMIRIRVARGNQIWNWISTRVQSARTKCKYTRAHTIAIHANTHRQHRSNVQKLNEIMSIIVSKCNRIVLRIDYTGWMFIKSQKACSMFVHSNESKCTAAAKYSRVLLLFLENWNSIGKLT